MARQKRSCSAGTGGRGQRTGRSAKARPDGIAAMHRDRVLQRNRDEDFAAKAAKICPEKPKQAFLHGKRTSTRPKNTVHAISAEAKQAEVAGDAIPRRTGKGIQRHNTPPELGKEPRGALKCVRPVRAGAAAGSRRLRRPHSIPPAAGPSCAAPACP